MIVMPLAEYLADPCAEPSFSSGTANAILGRSPLHAWYEHPRLNPKPATTEHANAMAIGAVAHSMFLERDLSRLVVVEAEAWRTKDAKAARDEAYEGGMVPLLSHQALAVQQIVAASEKALAECDELADIFNEAFVEQCCFWQDDGAWCRARPDLVSGDGRIVFNYKTTPASAKPDSYGNGLLVRNGYHIQAYHHAKGVAAETGEMPKCVWLVQETDPPYVASVLGMSPSLEALASTQWNKAIDVWRECLRTNTWPGYPNRVCWIEAKPWDIERWGAGCPHGLESKAVCALCAAS